MEEKKSAKADLEGKRGIFLEIGLILTLLIVWGAFEFSTKAEKAEDLGTVAFTEDVVEEIPITRQQEIELPPPPPQQTVAEILEVVEDDVKVEDTFIQEEADENTAVEIQEIVAPVQEEEQEEESTPFVIVEDMPEFKGGEKALLKYIAEHVNYPEMAKENDIQGTVYVGFVVNEKGKVTNVSVLRGVDPLLDKEAIKVIENLPDWKPGKQSGKNVKVRMQVPIKFQLAN
ncbi:MAG: energy transducer TonB [Bacteroidales bacterium]|nr:energy transducer TonB [Bacteroidales bacterium]